MVLGMKTPAVADAERESEAERSEAPVARMYEAPTALFQGPLDFRRPSVADVNLGQPSGGVFKALGVGMFVSAGADLASTELSLSRPGVYEMNPLQRNRSVRILSHVAAPAIAYWVTDKLHKKGNTRAALLFRIGFNVAYSYVVMHNLRTAQAFP
jgi:hypothetical protein